MQFALRGGGVAEIRGDTLVAGDQIYPVRDIVWVGLVVDPATASPGAPPNPAVGIQMRDGSHTALAPADPPDAWRLLGAIHEARPDLRGPVPPPPGVQAPGACSRLHHMVIRRMATRHRGLPTQTMCLPG